MPIYKARDHQLSLGVATVLIIVYVANLIYTLVTHRDIFRHRGQRRSRIPVRGWGLPLIYRCAPCRDGVYRRGSPNSSAAHLEATAKGLNLSKFFLGIVVLAIVGNIPEKASAIYFARRNRMGLVMTITVGSTIQIALLVAPLIVFISHLMGRVRWTWCSQIHWRCSRLSRWRLAVNAISQDGETTWFEGVLLLGVYLMLAMAFFFVG